MSRKCFRCGRKGHFAAECRAAEQARRLRAVPDPVPVPELRAEPELPVFPAPDLSRAHAYWDRVAPLPPIEAAWHQPVSSVRDDTPAAIARDVRLRTLAAQQVAESRAGREML